MTGLAFLNGWPFKGTDAPRPRPFCRIYLNEIATYPLKRTDFSGVATVFGDDLKVEEIADDHR